MGTSHHKTDTTRQRGWRLNSIKNNFAVQLVAMLLAVGLLPLLVYYVTSINTTEKAILDMASRQYKSILVHQRDYLQLQIEQVESLAANLGQVDEIRRSLQNSGAQDGATSAYNHLATQARIGYLLSNYRNMRGLVSIDLFSLDGEHFHVGDSLSTEDERPGLRLELLTKTTKSTASVVWHGVQDNIQRRSSTQKVIAATKMINRDDSSWLMPEPVGMLLINYSTDVLHAYLSQVPMGVGGQLLVVDDQGRFVYHADKQLIGATVHAGFLPLLQGDTGSRPIQLGGEEVLMSYERMPNLNWYVASTVPTSTLTAAMNPIRQVAWLLLLVSVLMVGLLVQLMLKRVVQPIANISQGFQRFEHGELAPEWRMPMPRSLPQVRELVAWFNAFLDGIEQRRQADIHQRIAATAFESHEGMFITDAAHRILQVNRAFTRTTGYSEAEAVGQTPKLLSSGRHDAKFYQAMYSALAQTGAWQGEIWNRQKNGTVYPEWMTITAVKDEAGHVTHYVSTLTDITERKTSEEAIKRLAFYDPLTGLPNRRLLLDRLEHAMLTCARSQQHAALLFLDLDKFKTLNDTLGHDMGDLLLQQVADRLTQCVRDCDTVARLGGDEFVVLVENLAMHRQQAANEVDSIGNKILGALNAPHELLETSYRSSSSMGITLFNDLSQPIEELMKQADMAMYQAKEAGRNTLRFFDFSMQASIMERVSAESELRQAIELEQFTLHYQPQLDAGGHITGAEVLLRWTHPVRGLVPPAAFVPLAEQTGLIVALGTWVIDMACEQLALWAKDPTRQHMVLAVNVSAKQFSKPNFAQTVLDALGRNAIRGDRLKLELTESLLVNDIPDVIDKMTRLKTHGISFSLDDFGTGYSSLSYLKQLPLDQLKIDQSFVRDVLIDGNDASIAKTIIALGHSMGLEVIAEGVETQAQQDFLLANGCKSFQGYLFSRPEPLSDFERTLTGSCCDFEGRQASTDQPSPDTTV